MTVVNTEVSFLPEAVGPDSMAIPAAPFKRCRLLLGRCGHDHLFAPAM